MDSKFYKLALQNQFEKLKQEVKKKAENLKLSFNLPIELGVRVESFEKWCDQEKIWWRYDKINQQYEINLSRPGRG